MERQFGSWQTAWTRFDDTVRELVSRPTINSVCEVGAGSHPALPLDLVQELGLSYTLLDVSPEALAELPDGYVKVVGDITSSELAVDQRFDLVVSRFLAEHIADPEAFHRNVLELLVDGGVAFHFFTTFYAPPFIANRALPESVSRAMVELFQPDPEHRAPNEKHPAYYRWCRGPTRRQLERFQQIGYGVEAYHGFFGTPLYYTRLKPVQQLDEWLTATLLRHPVPLLTSFAQITLRKPSARSRPSLQREARPAALATDAR